MHLLTRNGEEKHPVCLLNASPSLWCSGDPSSASLVVGKEQSLKQLYYEFLDSLWLIQERSREPGMKTLSEKQLQLEAWECCGKHVVFVCICICPAIIEKVKGRSCIKVPSDQKIFEFLVLNIEHNSRMGPLTFEWQLGRSLAMSEILRCCTCTSYLVMHQKKIPQCQKCCKGVFVFIWGDWQVVTNDSCTGWYMIPSLWGNKNKS